MSTTTTRKTRQAAPPPANAEYLDNAAAAAWLAVSPENLRKSRYSGLLCGMPAPAYLRLGDAAKSRVRYRVADLRHWLEAHAAEHTPRPVAVGQ